MATKGPPDDPYKVKQYMEWHEDDPRFQVRMLGMRVDTLTKEKEDLERELKEERDERKKLDARVASMENLVQRGAGAMIVLPVVGVIVGLAFNYGRIIFGPWWNK